MSRLFFLPPVLCLIVLVVMISLIFTIYDTGSDQESANIIVELPTGKINGSLRNTFSSTPYYSFQKIPFASPPLGELRFKDPQLPKNWDNILDTSQDLDVACVHVRQEVKGEDEDCLYLNVYTPELPTINKNVSYPVMFYIYGGAFMAGIAFPNIYGPQYFLDHGVVIVIFNYRVGTFGFLSTGDEVIPGNFGLKDQLLALKWTNENIALFGGNPNQITIFGHSSGAASVSYQLLHTKSEGLFQGAIMQSASALMPAALVRNSKDVAVSLAKNLDPFFNGSSQSLLNLLQTSSTESIVNASLYYYSNQIPVEQTPEIYVGLVFGPVIEPAYDGAFATEKPYVQYRDGNFVKVPILIGITSEEGVFAFDESWLGLFDSNLPLIIPTNIIPENQQLRINLATEIRDIYTNGSAFAENKGAGVQLVSDNEFNRATVKQSEFTQNYVDTYFYVFSYDGEPGGIDIQYEGADKVGHTEEIYYLWFDERKGLLENYSELDQLTSRRLLKIWTDFAKTGKPIPEPSELLQNVDWPVSSSLRNDSFLYLDINVDLELRVDPKKKTLRRWDEIFSRFGPDFDTY